MGNGLGRFTSCLCGGDGGHLPRRRGGHHHDLAGMVSELPYDEGLGHSFCYVRPDPTRLSSSKVYHSEEDCATTTTTATATTTTTTTTFRSISGASVSANTSTALSTSIVMDPYSYASGGLLPDRAAAAFDCSTSFSSVPLQPVPRGFLASGPFSGPMDRGFMSGPIERGFMSGPLERGIFSGPLDKASAAAAELQFQRSFSGGFPIRPRGLRRMSLIRGLRRAIAKTITRGHNSIVAPIKGSSASGAAAAASVRESDTGESGFASSNTTLSSNQSLDDAGDDAVDNGNLQWAQGKAGEDRVHVVISEEHGWVFVGIYDGFNGPDAPDYLLSNLYSAVHKELKGLLWDDKYGNEPNPARSSPEPEDRTVAGSNLPKAVAAAAAAAAANDCCKAKGSKKRLKGAAAKKWEENQRRWKNEWDRERLELDRKLKEQLAQPSAAPVNHGDVLKALSSALRKTEESYLDIADNMVLENPELALMGSCVLVMLMKGEDVYLMNVGDSRAVLAQKAEPDVWGSIGKARQDLERIKEETLRDFEAFDGDNPDGLLRSLMALQLTLDHSTCDEEEVQRIRDDHPDDALAVVNDRVKGSLKVTRAFGAGFLKQPKWNEALLEVFRIDYVGSSPYITCNPSLYHHRLGPQDRFLILSSDGLYQYFTNEEAVAEVETFIALFPEGDPAQHLVEEVLFRAAKKAGMDFHELLEIPQGDRRRYHDDVSIIVISLEGRIWRYCV